VELDAGSYLLTVIVSNGTVYAGDIEAVRILANLTTVYEKTFSVQDATETVEDGAKALADIQNKDLSKWFNSRVLASASGYDPIDLDPVSEVIKVSFIYSRLVNGVITVDGDADGWGYYNFEVSGTVAVNKTITYRITGGQDVEYTLRLIPVAEYKVEFSGGKGSTVEIEGATPTSSFTNEDGDCVGGIVLTKITVTGDNNGWVVLDEEDTEVTLTAVAGSTDSKTFTPGSQVYRVAVLPHADGALAFIKDEDIHTWVEEAGVSKLAKSPTTGKFTDKDPDNSTSTLYYAGSENGVDPADPSSTGTITIKPYGTWKIEGQALVDLDEEGAVYKLPVNGITPTSYTLQMEIKQKDGTLEDTVEYTLRLYPVARFEITIDPRATGGVTITDSKGNTGTFGADNTPASFSCELGPVTVQSVNNADIVIMDSSDGWLHSQLRSVDSELYRVTIRPNDQDQIDAARKLIETDREVASWVLGNPFPESAWGRIDTDAQVVYLYYIHTKSGNKIEFDLPSEDWSLTNGNVTGTNTEGELKTLTFTPFGSDQKLEYGLRLVPVAEYTVKFVDAGTAAATGTVALKGAGAGEDYTIIKGTPKKQYILTFGDNTVTYTGEDILEVNEGELPPFDLGVGGGTFTSVSAEYTVTVRPITTPEDAIAQIRKADLTKWVDAPDRAALPSVNATELDSAGVGTYIRYIAGNLPDPATINLTAGTGWRFADGGKITVDGLAITELNLTHNTTAEYKLWLVPVAQFNVKFNDLTSGTVSVIGSGVVGSNAVSDTAEGRKGSVISGISPVRVALGDGSPYIISTGGVDADGNDVNDFKDEKTPESKVYNVTVKTHTPGLAVNFIWADDDGQGNATLVAAVNKTEIKIAETLTFSVASPASGYTYQWLVNGTVPPTGANTSSTYTFTGRSLGTNKVTLILTKGGKTYSATVTVIVK